MAGFHRVPSARITAMATRVFGVPIAFISFMDENEQWFKSCIGMDSKPARRDLSFCGHAILQDAPLVIEDARKDERFHDNPGVVGPPHVRFYAGRPLRSRGGHKVGTLCIIDTEPRRMSVDDLDNLNDLAVWTEREIGNFEEEKRSVK